jgi:hypothetical protein
MKNVFMFQFESDQQKNDFKMVCSGDNITMQNKLVELVAKEIKAGTIRQFLKTEYSNNRITQIEYYQKLEMLSKTMGIESLNLTKV